MKKTTRHPELGSVPVAWTYRSTFSAMLLIVHSAMLGNKSQWAARDDYS
jgi:hypothetical protein